MATATRARSPRHHFSSRYGAKASREETTLPQEFDVVCLGGGVAGGVLAGEPGGSGRFAGVVAREVGGGGAPDRGGVAAEAGRACGAWGEGAGRGRRGAGL